MYAERLLQINMATLATLATLLVGMGLRNPVMPLGMMLAAMLAVWVTDFTRQVVLSPGVANLARIAALVYCITTLRMEREALITGVAWLLILLQIVVLFQKKESRTYWHLAELSLLQTVVAALLSQGALFGLLLMVYLLVGLSALTLLFLHEERKRYRQMEGATSKPIAANARWPLAQQEPWIAASSPGRLGMDREMLGRLLRTAAASLLLSVIAFFALPRVGQTAWRGHGGRFQATVGFSERVHLGHLGPAIENPQEVLRIRFLEESTGQRYNVQPEVYLRGAVLTEYERADWSSPRRPDFVGQRWKVIEGPADAGAIQPVLQKIQVESMDRPELFCVWPFTIPPLERSRIKYDRLTNRLVRADSAPAARSDFKLLTTAFENGRQMPLAPNEEGTIDEDLLEQLLQMPRENGHPALPGLAALAQQWIVESKLPAADRYHRACLLDYKLRESGFFRYSLQGQPRDPSIDPIEDFVANHPVGHCEYFATALAMMLRSQGIPARMIVGYRTGEWNEEEGFFQVRQSHAHTWVEAYVPADELPADVLQGKNSWQGSHGGWLRLDPTPVGDPTGAGIAVSQWFSGLDRLWKNYVMELNRSRQRETIYRPVAGTVKNLALHLFDGRWWSQLAERLRGWFSESFGVGGRWYNTVLVLILASVVIAFLGYRSSRWVVRHWTVPAGQTRGRAFRRSIVRIGFYRRLEAILARRGLLRSAAQTPREFAQEAGRRLAEVGGDQRLAGLPAVVAEAYYRVRFGGVALDKPQSEAVEQALGALDQATRAMPS